MRRFCVCLAVCLLQLACSAGAQESCKGYTGQYRDCTCGLQFRDREERCCSELTCFQPRLRTENFTCPLVCQNGGVGSRLPCNCAGTGRKGDCCEKETSCGGDLFAHSGDLTSPSFPGPYQANSRCVWRIATDHLKRIAIGVADDSFDLAEDCSDYLIVYDGRNRTAARQGPFCGNAESLRAFRTLSSTGRHLYIEFVSGSTQQTRKGFHLKYKTFLPGEECGHKRVHKRPTNIIVSPQYPLRYRTWPQAMNCDWVILLKERHELTLTVLEIDLGPRLLEGSCEGSDYILVSMRQGQGKHLSHLTAFCGQQAHAVLPYTIRGTRVVILKLVSRALQQGGRFKIRYEQKPIID